MASKKLKVLLAEDDLSLGYVIKDNLTEAGYEVNLYSDGQAAIDHFDKTRIFACSM
jgi:DNA-binding response OmpR family regulator